MKYEYKTQGTCAQYITFDLDGDMVSNIVFYGGCNGNLKAISKILDKTKVDFIEEKLKGNTCGNKNTSCADQLATAVRLAYDESKKTKG